MEQLSVRQHKPIPRLMAILLGLWLLGSAAGQVTSTDAAGDGSLREAIENATEGDTITFADDLAGETIMLTSGQLTVSVDDLTIDASGLANRVTVDGNNNSRIFHHTGDGTFEINTLVVRNGSVVGNGAGILSSGSVTVKNSEISNNRIDSSGGNGGGIRSTGNVIVTDSTISNNLAGDGGGGGIRSGGSVTITRSTISNNEGENGIENGGGVWSTGNVIVTDSEISDNWGSNGGGIYSNGGVAITITNSTVSGNEASGNGGGIWSASSDITITVTNGSAISGNKASGDGGGIFSSDGITTITNSEILNNEATFGGGIRNYRDVFVTDSVISGNGASFGAGGIFTVDDLSLSGCNTFEDNAATDVAGDQWSVNGNVNDGDIDNVRDEDYRGPDCPASVGGVAEPLLPSND